MGSRVVLQAPKDVDKKKKKAAEAHEHSEKQVRRKEEAGFGYTDIIEAMQEVEGLTYRPRTAEMREVYELMLSTVHTALGDQAQDVVWSAADMVLESLRDVSLKDFDKKREIEQVLGTIPNDQFSQLLSLSKKVTAYHADDEHKDVEIDDEVGVAVVFDEEEQEEEDDEGYEIREDSDGEEEGEEEEDEDESPLRRVQELRGWDKGRKAQKDIVSPHSIDGFWVQRQISEIYPNPVTAADKASSVLSILRSESSLRDCENQLMELFDFQSHHVIQVFIKNRDAIVWCTKLMCSDANERVNVEVTMREKGVGWILREFAGNKQTKMEADAMDVDETEPEVPKTATLEEESTELTVKKKGGWWANYASKESETDTGIHKLVFYTVAIWLGGLIELKAGTRFVGPMSGVFVGFLKNGVASARSSWRMISTPLPQDKQRILDLESMAFSQGDHPMLNKQCKLPDGSFERSKKGYEGSYTNLVRLTITDEIHHLRDNRGPVLDAITSPPQGSVSGQSFLCLEYVSSGEKRQYIPTISSPPGLLFLLPSPVSCPRGVSIEGPGEWRSRAQRSCLHTRKPDDL
ncbi:hypothetical protein P691DRAFT_855944 [Macrolepiota fuliginosa MF-IS2]|uniref:Uncharacterized protein n=1 Tax=Macrolepiota fuliginosa MF-IS2 TaxID=1400762 RepID=A0A9P5WY55_9AGAR|nr:hypothetical protein P691DRAFT_855944 [Macrolepiota fuliginosa MF-IS2]